MVDKIAVGGILGGLLLALAIAAVTLSGNSGEGSGLKRNCLMGSFRAGDQFGPEETNAYGITTNHVECSDYSSDPEFTWCDNYKSSGPMPYDHYTLMRLCQGYGG